MRAKDYLRQVRRLEGAIARNQQEKAILYARLTGRAVSYEGERVQASRADDPMADVVDKVLELDRVISEQTANYFVRLHEIKGQIERLDNDEFVILLFQRYIEGKSLEAIAVDMNYSYQHIRRLHGWALHAFEEQFAEEIAEYERCYTMLH